MQSIFALKFTSGDISGESFTIPCQRTRQAIFQHFFWESLLMAVAFVFQIKLRRKGDGRAMVVDLA
jgi:hypothetical protein